MLKQEMEVNQSLAATSSLLKKMLFLKNTTRYIYVLFQPEIWVGRSLTCPLLVQTGYPREWQWTALITDGSVTIH